MKLLYHQCSTLSQDNQSITANHSREPTKSGSKRKFSPEEDGFLADLAQEDDEFQFSRPGGSPQKKTDIFDSMRQDSPSKTPVSAKRGPSQSGITKRKVLEPSMQPIWKTPLACCLHLLTPFSESANSNLSSPKKIRATFDSDKKVLPRLSADENTYSPKKPKSIEIQDGALNQKPRVSRLVSQKPKRATRTIETEDHLEAEPKPTLLKDSPVAKAGDQAFGMSDMSAASRPSRRRGAVVSYAEPNLRVKMRRPSKNMIDAVAGADPRRSSSFQAQNSLDNEADTSQSGTSPHPPKTRPTSDQTQDENSDQVLATVSRRRRKVSSSIDDLEELPGTKGGSKGPTRRHSSNPKSLSREASRHETDVASDFDSSFEADDTAYRRETRVAARRKSMMV